MSKDQYAAERLALGNKIRELRNEQGLSLRKFGLMIGMDYSYLFDIEHGTANTTVDALIKIATGLDKKVSDLIDF